MSASSNLNAATWLKWAADFPARFTASRLRESPVARVILKFRAVLDRDRASVADFLRPGDRVVAAIQLLFA